jgi:hypothetical protein
MGPLLPGTAETAVQAVEVATEGRQGQVSLDRAMPVEPGQTFTGVLLAVAELMR